jgi:hypothetical protein
MFSRTLVTPIGRTKHFSRPPSAGYHRENSRRCRDEIGEAHRSRVPKRSNSRIVVDPTIVRAQLYNAVVIEGAPTEPASTPVHDISQLLRAWSDGDQLALDELTPIVYAELRRDAQNEHCSKDNDESRRRNGAFHDWPPVSSTPIGAD